MGNTNSQENEEEKDETVKKSKTELKVQIMPYVDGMPVLQSKL